MINFHSVRPPQHTLLTHDTLMLHLSRRMKHRTLYKRKSKHSTTSKIIFLNSPFVGSEISYCTNIKFDIYLN